MGCVDCAATARVIQIPVLLEVIAGEVAGWR
jgi:hypothetical protein